MEIRFTSVWRMSESRLPGALLWQHRRFPSAASIKGGLGRKGSCRVEFCMPYADEISLSLVDECSSQHTTVRISESLGLKSY